MAPKDLPEFLKKARRSALKKMATQLGGAPASAPVSPLGDGFGDAPSPAARPGPVVLQPSAQLGALWSARKGTPSLSQPQRDQLLATAAQLFAGAGYRRVSLEDVAGQVGLDRALVVAAFKSKEELLLQTAASEVDRFLAEARGWLNPKVDARELLRTISERAFEYMGHRPLLLQLMLGMLSELVPGNDDRLDELRNKFVSVIEEALRLGMSQGVFRAEIALPMTATLLFDLHVSGYLLHARATPDKHTRSAERRRVALDLVFNGLRAR